MHLHWIHEQIVILIAPALTRMLRFNLQRQRFSLYYVEHSTGVLLVLVCSSIVALSYNVVHSLMIQKTSAVTTTVLGEIKIVGLLLLSALLLGKPSAGFVLPKLMYWACLLYLTHSAHLLLQFFVAKCKMIVVVW